MRVPAAQKPKQLMQPPVPASRAASVRNRFFINDLNVLSVCTCTADQYSVDQPHRAWGMSMQYRIH